jgi:hypothetical protein
MRTLIKHERSVLKKRLPKKLEVRENAVGSAKVLRQRQEATADKAKRGRKRKSAAQEAPEPKAKVARISKAPEPASASVPQTSRTQVAEGEIAPESWRALVARMW